MRSCILDGVLTSRVQRPAPVAARHANAPRSSVRVAVFGEFFKGFFDGSWAPKSTRIWRQSQYEYPGSGSDSDSDATERVADGATPSAERAIEDLQSRVNSTPSSARPRLGADEPAGPSSAASSGSGSGVGSMDGSGFDGSSLVRRSFSEADDGDLAAALSRRIGEISASSMASLDGSDDDAAAGAAAEVEGDAELRLPLSAEELRRLIYEKYGKTYDVSFVRRDIPGKTFVSLNIMWSHLEQRSFNLTEAQYMEKLDGVAYLVGALGQTEKVRSFLLQPARSEKGLPRRPVVGTAISIRFDLEPGVIEEWFGAGYQ